MSMTPAFVRQPLYAALRHDGMTFEDQETLAIDWLMSQPGPPQILVGLMREYADSKLAERYPRSVVDKLGRRTGAGHTGPLLVAWPDVDDLGRLQGLVRATAICVIEGVGVLQPAWLRAQRAIDLTNGNRLEARADLVPPVIALAVRSLVPMLNGLSSSRDKPTVIDAFCQLRDKGYVLDPGAVYEFAVASGAEGDEAALMHEVATKLAAGHNYRRPTRLRRDIVSYWEREVAALAAKD